MDLPCGSCFTNRYAFHTLDIDGVTNVLSLRNLCFKRLSKNSRLFDPEHLSYLPFEILEDFKWFLSIHDLLKYSSVLEQAGVGTNCVWEKHFLKRYGQMSVRQRYFEWREPYVSHLSCDSYKAQYLQNHCSELLASLWNVESDCKCKESLCFFLKYAPSLILRWKRSNALSGMKIKNVISDNIQHLTVWGAKGTTFRYKEVKFLRSCKCLRSVYFKNFNVFSMYYCCHGDEEEDSQSVDQNLSFKSSVESVMASLGPEDIQFLLSDRFFESNIKRLNIISYENIISVCELHGKGWCDKALRKLTHLTLTGEILSEHLVDELIASLFSVFNDPVREPMKYLCLKFNGVMKFKFDAQKYSGLTYRVEEFEVLNTQIEEEAMAGMFIQFLQCNTSLSCVNFNNTSINLSWENLALIDQFTDIIANSNLQSLTTPILFWWLWDLCKMLADASKLSFLKVQGPGQIANMQDFMRILFNCKHLKTLSLQEVNLGAVGKDFLTMIFTSENSSLNNLDLRFCSIQGEDIVSAAQTALEARCSRKLHILDVSMNKINWQQQTTIKRLYKTLTDILIVDIPDRPQMEFVAQM